jgi:UDP-glucose 4-epimerase
LQYLRGGGKSTTLNVGYGHGYSVREVLRMVESVGGKSLVVREEARRAGDPAYLVARAERIRSELGWRPRHDDLKAIVSSALAWEQKLLKDPWT